MCDTLSIYEFSKLSGIESSTLRYWDELGLFSPIMRNPDNNYRYYSKDQLTELNFVITLSELGVPLKVIAELSIKRKPEDILSLLEDFEYSLDKEMSDLMIRYSIVHARAENLRLGLMANKSEISVILLSQRAMMLWPSSKNTQNQIALESFSHLSKFYDSSINPCFPMAGYHSNLDSFIDSPDYPNSFVSFNPIGTHKRIAGEYLVGYINGDYGKLGDLPGRMLDYAKSHSINITGPVYTYYLYDEVSTDNPDNYLAQCCVYIGKPDAKSPVRKR